MEPFQLVGPSYTSQSVNLSDQLTMNFYVESSEGMGQSPAALYPTPGTLVFANLGQTPIRGQIVANDRLFVVAGSIFFEVFSDGTFHNYGTVLNDSLPVSMAVGVSQIILASAGMVYVFDFSSGNLSTATLNQGGNSGIFASTLGGGGTGYAPSDTFTVNGGNGDATGIVDTVGGGGTVTGYHITSVGTNYAITALAPTSQAGAQPGVGTGLTINITAVGGGYAVNDTGTIQGGTTSATYLVTGVDASGNVTSFTITDGGSGYVVTNGVMTATGGAQPGIGSGFQINVTAVSITNTFTPLPNGTLLGPVSFVAYVEGFFVALLANSDQFQWSAPLDATSWDPLDTNKVSVFAGNVLSMFADHNELWFWGERQSQPYALTGSINTFDPIGGGFIEAGIFAPNSPVRLDNSIFWLGGDERGAGVVWRANGYTPSRVSNHAIEFALQGYLTTYGAAGLSTAVGYSYQDQGHGFYVLYFPMPSATWVFDVATGMWHQRGYWLENVGKFIAHRSQNHAFAFGKHLVGDWMSGNLYNMNISFYDDAGNPIRRVRRARHSSSDQSYVFHKTLQIYAETGVGPTPPLFAPSTAAASFILEDSSTALWMVTIDDAGLLHTTLVGSGTPITLLLNAGATTYQVGVTTGGLLTTTVVAPSSQPTSYALATTPSGFSASIDISGGLLQTNVNTTIGDPDGRDPMINLRWSNDGGHTWSNEHSLGIGKAGEYGQRIMFRRLGRARSRVYELSGSDPVPYRIVGAYLDVSAGEGA